MDQACRKDVLFHFPTFQTRKKALEKHVHEV
jgi:hypothetical protein